MPTHVNGSARCRRVSHQTAHPAISFSPSKHVAAANLFWLLYRLRKCPFLHGSLIGNYRLYDTSHSTGLRLTDGRQRPIIKPCGPWPNDLHKSWFFKRVSGIKLMARIRTFQRGTLASEGLLKAVIIRTNKHHQNTNIIIAIKTKIIIHWYFLVYFASAL